MSNLNEKSKVPLSWLIGAILFACTGAWSTAYFVFGVKMDIRELKADVKLLKHQAGIVEPEEAKRAPSFIDDAEASKR